MAPWLWWALALAAAAAALGYSWRSQPLVQPWETAIGLLSVLAYATLGALIVSRQRGNRVGWLFLGIAGLLALHMLSSQYAIYGLRVAMRITPTAVGAAWLQQWMATPLFFFIAVFVVIYPDGRLHSRFWLLPLAGNFVLWGVMMLGDMFLPHSIEFYPIWDEGPIALLATNPLGRLEAPVPGPIDGLWFGAFLCFTVTMAAPLLRYRRAPERVRQQLRWFMFLAATILTGFVIVVLAEESGFHLPIFADPMLILMLGFPLAVSLAILRHNLYELDVVINRTLVYGALTGALALVYFGSVVVLQLFLPERTALATVLSTLAVAGLFNPMRGRLQAWIDRRFYRRKYDAALALAGFAAQARDEVNLDRLVAALVTVLQETVQPAQVGVWLRKAEPALSPGTGAANRTM